MSVKNLGDCIASSERSAATPTAVEFRSQLVRTLTNAIALVLLVQLLSGCTRSVEWTEEVLLNTGATVLVNRTDTYRRSTEPGNPLQPSWQLQERAVAFPLNGRRYTYRTNTTDIFLIYHGSNTVSVVGWSKACENPGYVEWKAADSAWRLQPNIDPAVMAQGRNLMSYFSSEASEIPKVVSLAFKNTSGFNLTTRGNEQIRLDPSKAAVHCMENL